MQRKQKHAKAGPTSQPTREEVTMAGATSWQSPGRPRGLILALVSPGIGQRHRFTVCFPNPGHSNQGERRGRAWGQTGGVVSSQNRTPTKGTWEPCGLCTRVRPAVVLHDLHAGLIFSAIQPRPQPRTPPPSPASVQGVAKVPSPGPGQDPPPSSWHPAPSGLPALTTCKIVLTSRHRRGNHVPGKRGSCLFC